MRESRTSGSERGLGSNPHSYSPHGIIDHGRRDRLRQRIDQVHAAGKDAVVWTVNTEASMRRFLELNTAEEEDIKKCLLILWKF